MNPYIILGLLAVVVFAIYKLIERWRTKSGSSSGSGTGGSDRTSYPRDRK